MRLCVLTAFALVAAAHVQPTSFNGRILFCPKTYTQTQAGVLQTRDREQKEESAQAEMHASGIQAGIDGAQKDADDADASISPLLAKLTRGQRAAYDQAAVAMQHFIDVQVTGDYLYMGSYGSGGLYPNEEHAAFEIQVIEYLKQTPAVPSSAANKAGDDALNKVYAQLMAAAAPLTPLPAQSKPTYALTVEGLRKEQRAWLAYRDAFIAFCGTLHADVPAGAWQLPLTTARVKDLQTFYAGNQASFTEAARSYSGWSERVATAANTRAEDEKQRVAQIFDHLTEPQHAAWLHVQSALKAFDSAHAASVPDLDPSFSGRQLQALYGELYAIQYNAIHGFAPDPQKAADGFAKNDAALNVAYRTDLVSNCLFQPAQNQPSSAYRTPEGLRTEQRAWIALRDAWVSFLSTVYPDQSRDALANMMTGRRAFELQTLHRSCEHLP